MTTSLCFAMNPFLWLGRVALEMYCFFDNLSLAAKNNVEIFLFLKKLFVAVNEI